MLATMGNERSGLPGDFDPASLSPAWSLLAGAATDEIERELASEVSEGHPLFRCSSRGVALHRHRKEAVFWLPEQASWAVVHLTWSREADPRWPTTVLAADWSEVVAELADRGRS
jgi:hypothetical protein